MKLTLTAFALAAAAPASAQSAPGAAPPVPIPPAITPTTAGAPAPALAAGPPMAGTQGTRATHLRHRPPSAAELRVRAANHAATLDPARDGFINAVQIFPFNDGAIYHVFTAPGQVTDIALQPGEALGSVAAGDTVRWVIGDTTSGAGEAKRAHVLVKPFTAGLATNILVTTDRRVYHLSLTSTERTAMSALSWSYPADQLITLKAAADQARAAAPIASGLRIDQLRFDYAISGDRPAWRPLRAFDDGRQTFIEFPATLAVGEAPPLFLVDAKGTAALVNYRVEGRYYVVDRLFDAAELRLGLKRQDIVRITRQSDTPKSRKAS